MDGFLFQALLYLAAGVIAVPIARRLGLGSVLGYLAAGVLIGPVLHLVGVGEASTLQQFAEFGVVMMLFVIGLELEPSKLWKMRDRLLGMGGLQVVLTGAALTAGLILIGLAWREALAIGFILALSSTAVVLQTLREKGWMQTEGGRASFSVLLFQDIAVIPMLAALPLLALPAIAGGEVAVGEVAAGAAHGPTEAAGHGGAAWTDGLPGWAQAFAVVAAIAGVIAFGRYLTRPAFRFIAKSRLSEIFTAAALLLVVAIAYLMTKVGLSPALGAFVAGVVLADSEFKHELESDIEPFKGLLLGLFFITVGAGVRLDLIGSQPALVLGLAAALIAVKAVVLLGLGFAFGLPTRDRMLAAFGLAQGGEFAFVLLGLASGAGVAAETTVQIASLVVALSMLATPLIFLLYQHVLLPQIERRREARAEDAVDERGPVIIAGVGRFGQIVSRMLVGQGFRAVVIDHESDMVDTVARFGQKAFYGDASRPEMLRQAGIEEARLFVVAVNEREASVRAVEFVKRTHPNVKIIARAFDRVHYYELRSAGADIVIRELFDASLRAAESALTMLGVDPQLAARAREVFRSHDEEMLEELYGFWRRDVDVADNPSYVEAAKRRTQMLQNALQLDREAEEERRRTA